VRRALLVARNLPTIDVSPAFSERLQARLATERASIAMMRSGATAPAMWRWGQLSAGAYVMVAAGMLAAAGLASVAVLSNESNDVIRLAPVVASMPEPEPELMTPTMVAAVPAGMPLWSAVFVAQQAPYHFASDEASR
jgi:hypothetical protein